MKKVLITGFGPFPGAPRNPTMAIVRHLMRLRFSDPSGLIRVSVFLPTTWDMLDDFRHAVAAHQPDAILMFGVAGRRRKVTPESRAINRACIIRCDAQGRKPQSIALQAGGPTFRRSTIDALRLTARLTRAGIAAKLSYDAGDYLCNALLWVALESGVPSIFVHVPSPGRTQRPQVMRKAQRPAMRDLALAGEIALAMVAEVVSKR